MSRAFHSKSRNGCSQCKKRRVKCNMQLPRCHHCRRRGEVCDLQWRVPGTSPQAQQQSSSSSLGRPIDSTSIQDIGFLGYYADVVYTDVSLTPWGNWFWGIEVPKQAETAHYLARAISAISILHLTDSKSLDRDRHAVLAQGHFHDALAEFRSEISAVNADNCVAAFMFAKLVIFFQMRMSCAGSEVAAQRGAILEPDEVVNLWRRTAEFARSLRPLLVQGTVSRLFVQKPGLATPDLARFIDEALPQLSALDQVVEHSADRGAIEVLRQWFDIMQMEAREGRQLSFWPDSVPAEYVLRLGNREPISLVIFIYWCAGVHLTYTTWSVAGYPQQVATSLEKELGSEWGEFLQSPLRVLRG